jgi:tRNA-uridine 2-sulfurtransferase
MLARLDPRFLERLWFPLGEHGKDETRAEAARAGLEVASRGESQEACFLAGGDYREFLERHGLPAEEGSLVDEDGNEVGSHAGFWRFTPGQRKGLGVSAPEPLYALRSDAATNTVVVGPRAALATRNVNVRGRLHVPVSRAEAKVRHRSPAVSARVTATDSGFRLELDRPAYGVAPGQAAVLYDEGAVIGAGTILADPAETSSGGSAFETEGE